MYLDNLTLTTEQCSKVAEDLVQQGVLTKGNGIYKLPSNYGTEAYVDNYCMRLGWLPCDYILPVACQSWPETKKGDEYNE